MIAYRTLVVHCFACRRGESAAARSPNIAADSRRRAKKKPTWLKTRRFSTTSAYSLMSFPAVPGRSLFSHPTFNSVAPQFHLEPAPLTSSFYDAREGTQVGHCVDCAVICYNAIHEITLNRKNKMHQNRRMRCEALEAMLQYRNRQKTLAVDDLIEERLNHLQVFIGHLTSTPHGLAEIERRTKCFGACKRIVGETSGEFYGKLRHWLDRDLPQTRSPLHAASQSRD